MPKEAAFLSLMRSHVIPTPFPSLHRHAQWGVKRDFRAKCYSMNGKSLPHAQAAVDSLVLFWYYSFFFVMEAKRKLSLWDDGQFI